MRTLKITQTFRVWGSGFRVPALELKLQKLLNDVGLSGAGGFRVQGLEFRV